MPNVPTWRRYLRFWRSDVTADVDEELRFHFAEREAELRTTGLSPEEARMTARREFGDVDATRDRLREIGERIERRRSQTVWWDALGHDVRYALRACRARPTLTAAVVATIALALAATMVMFGVIDRLFLRPPPHVARAESVGHVHVAYVPQPGVTKVRGASTGVPYGLVQLVQSSARSVRAAGVFADDVVIGTGPQMVKQPARYVSPGYFALLGVRPALGRFLTDEEAHHLSHARVVVLGYAMWRRTFGGDTTVLGRSVVIGGAPYTVVGVAPPAFHGTGLTEVGVWLPMAARYDAPNGRDLFTRRGNLMWLLVVRRLPGVTLEQAAAELTPLVWTYESEHEEINPKRIAAVRVAVFPMRAAIGGDMQRTPVATVSVWLAGVTAILLLIACANVAGLLLLRAAGRRQELLVRLALGVGRARLATQLLVESLLLTVAGGVGAVVLAATGGVWLRRLLLPQLAPDTWTIDGRMLGVATAATLATALLTGVGPAFYAARADRRGTLVSGAGRGVRARPFMQRPLLMAQTALSLVLLVGAGLFLRSVDNLRTADLGMRPQHVVTVTGDFSALGPASPQTAEYFARARNRVRTIPGVEATALSSDVPLETVSVGGTLHGDGIDSATVGRAVQSSVSAGFFEAMGARVLRGRAFGESDVRGAPPVVVVNETLARRLWPNATAIGRCFVVGPDPECRTVVGVVRDMHLFHVVEETQPQYYLPLAQRAGKEEARVLLVRTAGDVSADAARIAHALERLDANQPFLDVRVLEDRLDPEARPWRLGATVFTVYGGFALLLAALGLYSMMAHAVTTRTREIGVRVAVGGQARHVVGLVLRDGLLISLAGVALGFPAALLLGARVQGLLLGVGPRDLLVLGTATALLAASAALAGFLPARRATRVSPTEALRAD